MEMRVEALDGGITRINLAGRMDYAGASEIDSGFMAVAGRDKFLLVDLSKVNFLASMGIRTLITAAKAVKERGGKMILFAPDMMVAKVLKTSGTEMLIPVYYDLSLARNALQPSPESKG
jgi:anti-anti-sigma factor